MTALRALSTVRRLSDHARARPLDYVRWTPPQLAFLRCTDRRVLLRTGNQIGKTWALCGELIYRCTGRHPYKPIPPPPVKITLLTATWGQSVAVQSKLWELCPKDEIVEGTEFDEVLGFGTKNPALRFRNGSLIKIKTGKQGGLRLASETVDVVAVDEPPEHQRVYSELERRLTRTGGALLMGMTPINAPVEWVHELADAGKITDLHFAMTPEIFIPEGEVVPLRTKDGRPMDQAWIDEQRASVMPHEEPIVIDGEWEMRAVGRMFVSLRDDVHLVPHLMQSDVRPSGKVEICVGLDYGEDSLRTIGALVYVDSSGEHDKIYIVGEYAPDSASTLDMDAAGILSMLAAQGDRWSDIDEAWGDKRYSDKSGRVVKKSNRQMLAAIAAQMQTGGELRPIIRGAKKGAGAGKGSVWRGVRWLHDSMIRPGHFYIDPIAAPWITECLRKWDGREMSKFKDGIDAVRYALRHRITPRTKHRPQTYARGM